MCIRDSIVAARPQRGLSKADILFEIKVEGGITRFMPVFTDYKTIGEVGPVRSGRDQFFRLILPWQALYIHCLLYTSFPMGCPPFLLDFLCLPCAGAYGMRPYGWL